MPNIDIATPVSSAPTDRLALGVGWVRPHPAWVSAGTLNPSGAGFVPCCSPNAACFEGDEE